MKTLRDVLLAGTIAKHGEVVTIRFDGGDQAEECLKALVGFLDYHDALSHQMAEVSKRMAELSRSIHNEAFIAGVIM